MMLRLQMFIERVKMLAVQVDHMTAPLTAEQKALPALGGPMGTDLIKSAVLRTDLMNLAGLLQLFQLAVYRGQPHGISAQPQLFGQSRCADGLFTAVRLAVVWYYMTRSSLPMRI